MLTAEHVVRCWLDQGGVKGTAKKAFSKGVTTKSRPPDRSVLVDAGPARP